MPGTNGNRGKWCIGGARDQGTNGVTGVEHAVKPGPMGIRGRENILENYHIRAEGWSGPMGSMGWGYINIKQQRSVGRSPSSPCP